MAPFVAAAAVIDRSSFLLGFVCGGTFVAFAVGASTLWWLNQ